MRSYHLEDNVVHIQCPACKAVIEASQSFLNTSDKLCCMGCNKAFKIPESLKKKEEKKDVPDDFWSSI